MNYEELLENLNEECTKLLELLELKIQLDQIRVDAEERLKALELLELKIQLDQIRFDAEERLKAQEAAVKLAIERCFEVKW